ncbi:MAG TPA: hypothetical protein ENJ79_09040 [Gammaproteobacteria bacterium]|nr:hypothetical protein [Gammaproteobacteria bacterium]
MPDRLTIELFSDVLCIWAWAAQVRIDQLKNDYGARVRLEYRFIPVFGAAHARIEQAWKTRDGYTGFNRHLLEVASGWDHVQLNPDVWRHTRPHSSIPAHLCLKAVQQLEQAGELGSRDGKETPLESFLRRVRRAFFEQARDIGRREVLEELIQEQNLPLDKVRQCLDDGSAAAALHLDTEARDRYQIPGSPTLIFNEGRQRLYGNVGYRIIEANIRELLDDRHHGLASWC